MIQIEKISWSNSCMCNILLVEDDVNIRTLFRKILIANGYEVIEATDGEEALRLYEELEKKPELIILDHLMPKKSGLEVTQELLKQHKQQNILIITGHPSVDLNCFANETVKLKLKPISVVDFLSEIQGMIQV
jgi:CheY-like chemotaxis protein